MIAGVVNDRLDAAVTVSVSATDGRASHVEAVVDTGFSMHLTLPRAVVNRLRLPYAGRMRARLADGSEAAFALFDATIYWDDEWRSVAVAAAETKPLVGMALLEGHNLSVDVHRGGRVLIQPGRAA